MNSAEYRAEARSLKSMAQLHRRKGIREDQDTASKEEAGRNPEQQEGKQDQITQRRVDDSAGNGGYSGRYQGSSGRSREDEDLKSLSSQTDVPEKGLESLQQEEMSGTDKENIRSVGYSDTDEDEDEGLGDGNLGRSVRGSVDE